MIRFDDVTLRYGQGPEVFDRINLEISPGTFHFVVGESGAGKSSLMRIMSLSQAITSGKISLLGRDCSTLERGDRALLRRKFGLVFQNFRLLDHLTVLENVMLPLTIAGQAGPATRPDVEELLKWIGLGEKLEALPATLSGGEQQRVAVARAVVGKPSVLLGDEPTGNLDDRLALRLLHLFEELNKMGTTVVIATHNRELVSRFQHPILHLKGSSIELEPEAGAVPSLARTIHGGALG